MMRARRAIVSGALATIILGAIWIANDDHFGRPSTPSHLEIRQEDLTIFAPPKPDTLEATFTLCDGPIRVNCVVDGDTFWFKGDKIRIADIDAPEISSPHCKDEKQAGEVARDRLLTLLNAGAFSLESGWRNSDRYGRKLRTVTRDYQSLGEALVEEGLARRWDEPRRDWCALE